MAIPGRLGTLFVSCAEIRPSRPHLSVGGGDAPGRVGCQLGVKPQLSAGRSADRGDDFPCVLEECEGVAVSAGKAPGPEGCGPQDRGLQFAWEPQEGHNAPVVADVGEGGCLGRGADHDAPPASKDLARSPILGGEQARMLAPP